MRKLTEVRQAKELMSDAIDWSVFKWMFEKPRVREAADLANDALDHLEQTIKANWCDELRTAYREVSAESGKTTQRTQKGRQAPQPVDPQIRLLAEEIREADEAARRARIDAEEIFDEAEKYLNITLAREGCQKAIHSWELHEKAIRRAESAMESAKSSA